MDAKNNLPKKQAVKKAQPKDRAKTFGIMLLLILALGAGYLGGYMGSQNRSTTGGINKANQQVVLNESQLISDIAKQVGPSVVSINVTASSQQTNFFGFSSPVQQQGAGTGVIISTDGYIITNRHVIPSGTTDVQVVLSDGTEFSDVEVIGRTTDNDPLDIAFLKIKNTKDHKLTAAKLGDSSKLQVGDKVVAIGNALGQFQNSVTSGIISGFGRSVEAGSSSGTGDTETLQNLLQTDAAINEGNSGGPLVNIDGEVIGINTAIAGGQAQNIGFAIPMNDAKGLVTSVLKKGKLERPYLGVRFVTLNDEYAYQYNLNVKRGAYIAPSRGRDPIIKDSPADKAGLKEKDIVIKVNGTSIDETHSLTSLVGQSVVGDEVTLTIIRDGKEQSIKVKLEAMPTS